MNQFLGPDGWLLPGRHEASLDEVEATFVPNTDARRVSIMRGIRILISGCTEAWSGGVLLIAGDFVSRHHGPVSRPTVIVVPDEPGEADSWPESKWDRVRGYFSLHDVILGSLGPDYAPVLHSMSGLLEVELAYPEDADAVGAIIGAVTMSDGSDLLGARGVMEVGW